MNKKTIIVVVGVLLVVVVVAVLSSKPSLVKDSSVRGVFSNDTAGLIEAKSPETVILKNGDTYELRATPLKKTIAGREIRMLGFNGSIPGPVIKVEQGSEVTINFVNEIGMPMTLHSHGVRLENAFDGVPGVTQEEVKSGASFSYKIKFPDPGAYWYHPHMREDYAQELGLYGSFIVAPRESSYWQPVTTEAPIFLDDLAFDANGLKPFYADHVDHTLMGRFGNVMFTNGTTDYKLSVVKGTTARLYLTNAANTRVFKVSIPGLKMKLVGADGGKYERETFVDSITLAPSERAIVELLFTTPGNYRLTHTGPQASYVLGTIEVADSIGTPSPKAITAFETLRANKDMITEFDSYRSYFNKTPDKYVTLTIDMAAMMGGNGMMNMMDGGMSGGGHMHGAMGTGETIEWEDMMPTMNVASTDESPSWKIVDRQTNKSNMDIQWSFAKGDKVKIRIFNDDHSMHPMQHPIHFHGQRFLVLTKNGVKNDNLVWKDSTLLGAGETVEILLDASNPGMWMAHCHIAEHLHAGMMFGFEVK